MKPDSFIPTVQYKVAVTASERKMGLIPTVHNTCTCLGHFERSKAESRNLFLIDFSTSGHFMALRSK
jgi:hypothetical protein